MSKSHHATPSALFPDSTGVGMPFMARSYSPAQPGLIYTIINDIPWENFISRTFPMIIIIDFDAAFLDRLPPCLLIEPIRPAVKTASLFPSSIDQRRHASVSASHESFQGTDKGIVAVVADFSISDLLGQMLLFLQILFTAGLRSPLKRRKCLGDKERSTDCNLNITGALFFEAPDSRCPGYDIQNGRSHPHLPSFLSASLT